MKVEVAIQGSLSLTVPTISVDVKQHRTEHSVGQSSGAQELCECRGGHLGLPVHNSPYGLCGRKATLNERKPYSEFRAEPRSGLKREVELGSHSWTECFPTSLTLTVLAVADGLFGLSGSESKDGLFIGTLPPPPPYPVPSKPNVPSVYLRQHDNFMPYMLYYTCYMSRLNSVFAWITGALPLVYLRLVHKHCSTVYAMTTSTVTRFTLEP